MSLMSGFDPKQSLALPQKIEHWSLATLREKLIKIGANGSRAWTHKRDKPLESFCFLPICGERLIGINC